MPLALASLESRYERMLAALYQRELFGIQLGLGTTRRLLAHLDHPEKAYPAILVSGTNGKGSTAAMIASILRAAELRVGLFTSPHLLDYRERIRVNGLAITPGELLQLGEPLLPLFEEEGATYFEAATALGFLHFARQQVDVAVVEVGLGGRLDATNVLPHPLAVITDVDFDHRERLGKTLGAIAGEKAGIIRRHGEAVTACQRPAAVRVVRAVARRRHAQLIELAREARVRVVRPGPDQMRFRLATTERNYGELGLPLIGAHQGRNAALAVLAVERWAARHGRVDALAIRRGLAETRWPGRCEIVARRPLTVVDAAHNPSGATTLGEALAAVYPGRRPVLLFGSLASKDHHGMLRALLPHARALVLARPSCGRTTTELEELARVACSWGARPIMTTSVAEGLAQAQRLAGATGMVLVTGSCYMVADVMAALGFGVVEQI